MKESIYRISLDIQSAYANVALDAKRADTGRMIHITLTDGGFPYQISPECYAVFTATKPDGNKVFNHCTIEGNTIIYKITPQTVAAVGMAECEIKVYGAEDQLLTSACFNLVINETVIKEEDEIESETEVDALTHLISEATTAIYDTKEATKDARQTLAELEESQAEFEQNVADARNSAIAASESADHAMASMNTAQNAAAIASNASKSATTSASASAASEAASRSAMETAVSSAAAAVEAAQNAQRSADTIDIELINSNIAAKADDLHYDEETGILHLMSNGKTIGTGVKVESAEALANKFAAVYGTTTTAEIYEAYQAGKSVVCSYRGVYTLALVTCTEDFAEFGCVVPNGMMTISCSENVWSASNRYAANTITESSDNSRFPTAKAVYDFVQNNAGNVDLTGYVKSVNGMTPDENGNVEITIPDSGGNMELDTTLTQSGKAADAKVVGDKIAEITGISLNEPAEDDIPKVFFGGALQQTKDEKVVPFRYISKTEDISGYAEIKAQGNSSMSYPKKNQTVKLFKDAACEEKLKVDFKGWGKQNKYVYKANWIDISHARNVVSARLWADVVKSRVNYAELPELLRTSPNTGAVDGFPIKVYADGVYQGRYTLNIPKDKWAFNMDDNLDEHCVLCGENYSSGCFRAAANIDESDWTDEIHDVVPTSIKTRWNEVISFVMTATDEEFKANLGSYFYVDSLIDYHLFGLISCGLDAYGKNQLYATYDGQKWIASMYDMDSTWGLYWNGSKFVATDYARTSYEDYVSSSASGEGNLLYNRLEECFWEELQARWAELRSGALSIENIINRFERFTDIAQPELVEEDYATTTGGGSFTGIPSKTTNNIQQIRSFALARQAWTNEYVAALTPEVEVSCTSISLDKNELTFTAAGDQTITATATPDGCTDSMVWVSSNPSVAIISVDGNVCTVTAVANGDTTITVTCGEYSTSCAVSISGIEAGEGGDSGDSVIDYTKDALSGATWQEGYAIDRETGVISAKASHYITEEITLQDCKYSLTQGLGNTYVSIVVYNADGDYIAAYEGGKSVNLTFIARPDYKYRVQVYTTTATHANATLIPVVMSDNTTYISLNLADMSWTLSNNAAETTLSTDVTTAIADADQANEFVLITSGGYGSAQKKSNAPNIFVVDTKYNVVIAPYFNNVDSAVAYFTENSTVLEFNKRHK